MEPSLDIKPDKICRVCLCDSNELKSLKAKLGDEDKTILEAINFVVNIDIKIEIDLPDKICKDCETILDLADIFKRRCLDSEEILGQQYPTIEQEDILNELPVSLKKKPELSTENTALKNVVDKLIKKENDLAIYANVTISKHKKSKTNNPKLDPVVIEIDDEELKVEEETPLDDYENTEYLNDTVNYDEILDTDATSLETETKQSKLKKPKAGNGKKGLKKKAVPKKEPKTFTCEKCGELFRKKNTLRIHITRKHDKRHIGDFECDICKKKYKSRCSLNKHLFKKHRPTVLKYDYPCKKCSRQFKYKTGLMKHVKLWHETSYSCKECHLKFKHRKSFEDHKKEHSDKVTDKHLCTICGRWLSFTTLPQHIRRHKNIRAFHCEKCEKSFISKAEVKVHMRSHTGDRNFLCPICGRGFSTSSGMKCHRDKHSDARPYSCEFCSMSFKAPGILNAHRRTHTGEKPYKCPLCDAVFRRSHHLLQHLRRHARDTPNINDVITSIQKPKGRPPKLAEEGEISGPDPVVFKVQISSQAP